jgi:hypothetical protein
VSGPPSSAGPRPHDTKAGVRPGLAPTSASEFFKAKVFDTVIPRNIRLGEAPSHGMPAVLYDEKSRGAVAYLALADEMLARQAARGVHQDPGREHVEN